MFALMVTRAHNHLEKRANTRKISPTKNQLKMRMVNKNERLTFQLNQPFNLFGCVLHLRLRYLDPWAFDKVSSDVSKWMRWNRRRHESRVHFSIKQSTQSLFYLVFPVIICYKLELTSFGSTTLCVCVRTSFFFASLSYYLVHTVFLCLFLPLIRRHHLISFKF